MPHESGLDKAPSVAVNRVPAILVSPEVAEIDDAKRTHSGECPSVRSVERACPVSELDALALFASRQGQTASEGVLIGLGPLLRDRTLGWCTD